MMIIEALSGLGIFLFGMAYMESALKEMAGIRLKRWIKNSTSTTFKAILTGTIVTAALQSSSVVTLLTLSFVSASLISLSSGIGVIFGSNLGTTVTAWIVATLGFKVKIELFALPMIGAGGFGLIFSANRHIVVFSKVLIGFGLLFFGLELMKEAIETVAQSIDLAQYIYLPLIVFVLLGLFITALIQSSSAATAIVLSAIYANILSFDQAAAMVIGTNIGTTVTALLGSIGGIPDKKRAAVAHLFFNLLTAIVAFMILPFSTSFLLDTLALKDDLIIALALFHTIFNLLGVVLLASFIPLIAHYLERLFKHQQQVATKYIHKVDAHIPDTAMVALRDEVSRLFSKTMKFALLVANIKPNDVLKKGYDVKSVIEQNPMKIDFDHHKAYEKIKEIELSTLVFTNILNQQNLTRDQSHKLDTLMTSIRESVYAAKLLKDVRENMNEFYESDNKSMLYFYNELRQNLAFALNIFQHYIQESWSLEECKEKFQKAQDANNLILKEATSMMSSDRMNKTMLISLLNTNRSVYIAITSLFSASKGARVHFLLEHEE